MRNVVNLRSYADVSLIPTLVLLDLQQEYVASPRLFSIPEAEQALENCRLALTHSRRDGISGRVPAHGRTVRRSSIRCCPIPTGFRVRAADVGDGVRAFQALLLRQSRIQPRHERGRRSFRAGGIFRRGGLPCDRGGSVSSGHSVTYLADASASLGLNRIPAPTVHETVAQLIGLYGEVTTTRSWIAEQTASVSCLGGR